MTRNVLPGVQFVAACALLLTAASSDSASANSESTCTGVTATSPDEDCSAYYYRAGDELGTVTQVLVECRSYWVLKAGGNVVAFHDGPATGIGLRWISDEELEVAIDPSAPVLRSQTNRLEAAGYWGKRVRFTYRDLTPSDPEWTGCALAAE